MKIFIIFYLINIFSFQAQPIHLCKEEKDKNECLKCMENSKLEGGQCKCLDGYVSHEKVNKCYSCLPNCKECDPFKLNQCKTCFGENADPQNQCICNNGFIFYSPNNTCIDSKQDINLAHLNFHIQQKTFENVTFNFCQPTQHSAQTDSMFKLKIKDTNSNLDLFFAQLNNQSKVAYKQSNEMLIFEKNLLQKIKSRPIIRDYNETIFEISYTQGLSSGSEETNQEQNLILIIEIKNIIQNSYYFYFMECQSQTNKNLEQQKIQESNVNQIIDQYFNLFYQCPSNCEKCNFEIKETKLLVICQQCINGMRLENGKCIYENQLIKMREIKQKQEKIECDSQTYIKDGQYCTKCDIENCETCKNQSECSDCEQQLFNLKDGKCECIDNNEQCKISQTQKDNCIYFKDNTCFECKQNYYLYKNECFEMISNDYLLCIKEEKCYNCLNMETPIEYSASKKNNCECQNGYFMDYRLLQCKNCDENCQNCINRSIKCTSCMDGFYLQDSKCKECPITCSKCESIDKCTSCQYGNYLDKSQCKQCKIMIDGKNVCEKCISDKICTEAKEGYYINSQKQVKKCDKKNCKQCNEKECERCETEYFVEKGSCTKCPKGCTICERNQELDDIKCFNCLSGYTLSDTDGTCLECPEDCDQCATQSTCYKCKAGLKLQDGKQCVCENKNEYFKKDKCQICQNNCEKCKSKDQCEVCNSKYDKNDKGECVKKKCKIENCEECSDDNSCEKCKDSIFDSKKKVCGCQDNCSKCRFEDQKQKCISCQPKFYLKDYQCVDSHCLDEQTDGNCKKCEEKYFINSNKKCEQCQDKKCQTCENNKCTKCIQGYFVENEQCQKCTDQYCLICSPSETEQSEQCDKCQEGYSIKENKCYKENNLFPLLSLVFIIALIYGAFYFKDQILSLCSNKESQFANNNFQDDVELTKQSKTKPDSFNILED